MTSCTSLDVALPGAALGWVLVCQLRLLLLAEGGMRPWHQVPIILFILSLSKAGSTPRTFVMMQPLSTASQLEESPSPGSSGGSRVAAAPSHSRPPACATQPTLSSINVVLNDDDVGRDVAVTIMQPRTSCPGATSPAPQGWDSSRLGHSHPARRGQGGSLLLSFSLLQAGGEAAASPSRHWHLELLLPGAADLNPAVPAAFNPDPSQPFPVTPSRFSLSQ